VIGTGIIGADAVLETRVLDQLINGLEEDADTVVLKFAYDIEADIQESFGGPKSGRFYGRHQASAAGESPAVGTGNLRNTVGVAQRQKGEALVVITAEYAAYLEYGTRYMAARPFVQPAVNKRADEFREVTGRLFNV